MLPVVRVKRSSVGIEQCESFLVARFVPAYATVNECSAVGNRCETIDHDGFCWQFRRVEILN